MDETSLVRGLRERHDGAVRVFLERYRSLFQHCAAQFEGDRDAREDLLQELAWYALERLDDGNFDAGRGSFGSWLYRVAWCRCVDLTRQRNARRRLRVELRAEDLGEEPDQGAGPDESTGEREIADAVQGALACLEDEDRRLLQSRIVEGRPLGEVAGEAGITIEQAKYRLKRAASELRKALLMRYARQEIAG